MATKSSESPVNQAIDSSPIEGLPPHTSIPSLMSNVERQLFRMATSSNEGRLPPLVPSLGEAGFADSVERWTVRSGTGCGHSRNLRVSKCVVLSPLGLSASKSDHFLAPRFDMSIRYV